MTSFEKFADRYAALCRGNQDALSFLLQWHIFCHSVDDLIDRQKAGEPITPEKLLATFTLANCLYSTAFYRTYAPQLQPVVILVTNAYADSVSWESDPEEKKRHMADIRRHCGNEMVCIVAYICGGYEHMRSCSPKLWEDSYDDHHTEDGTPK